MKKIVLNLLGAMVMVIGSMIYLNNPVNAIVLSDNCPAGGSSSVCASTSPKDDLGAIIKQITNVMFFIIGAIAVVMIIYSGIRYTTSAGNPAGVTAAKNSLIYSIVGLVVAILAYAIVNFVVTRIGWYTI